MGQTFPLGTSDFRRIRENNRLYVDKTKTIELMEKSSDFITFLRPRRFGKSLLVSTLFYYYDIKSVNLFNELFGDLYIGKHPTNEKNTYFILNLNFSSLEISNSKNIEESFREMILSQLEIFIHYYAPKNKIDEFLSTLKETLTISTILRKTIFSIAGFNGKVYVLIDEYDHFTNRMIFSELKSNYKSAVQSSGFIRQFFTTLKALTSGPIKRIFITGVLPILLNDMTSGFNISKLVSHYPQYQGAIGFTDDDIKQLLKKININSSEFFDRIKYLYNGYMFAYKQDLTQSHVYNPQMTLYYLDSLQSTKSEPANIINNTILTDKNKFEYLLTTQEKIQDIIKIMKDGTILSDFEDLLDLDKISDPSNLATILFHFGLLTFKKYTQNMVTYKIPNHITKLLYEKYFKKYLQTHNASLRNRERINNITNSVLKEGNLQPLISFLQNEIFPTFSFRDTIGLSEQSIKFILIMFFKYTSYYEIITEKEFRASQNQGGFGDLLLLKSQKDEDFQENVQVDWLFELKYIKKGNLNLKNIKREQVILLPKVKEKMEEGKTQLNRYKKVYEKEREKGKSSTEIKYAVILFIGKEFVFFEEI